MPFVSSTTLRTSLIRLPLWRRRGRSSFPLVPWAWWSWPLTGLPRQSANCSGCAGCPASRESSSSPVASGIGSARPTGGGGMPSTCTACRSDPQHRVRGRRARITKLGLPLPLSAVLSRAVTTSCHPASLFRWPAPVEAPEHLDNAHEMGRFTPARRDDAGPDYVGSDG